MAHKAHPIGKKWRDKVPRSKILDELTLWEIRGLAFELHDEMRMRWPEHRYGCFADLPCIIQDEYRVLDLRRCAVTAVTWVDPAHYAQATLFDEATAADDYHDSPNP